MKVLTDFGIMEIKPKKTFVFDNVKFCLLDVPQMYLNAKEPLIMRRIAEYKTSSRLPISFSHKQTNKSMIEQAIEFLSEAKKQGHNIFEMVQNTKDEIIND